MFCPCRFGRTAQPAGLQPRRRGGCGFLYRARRTSPRRRRCNSRGTDMAIRSWECGGQCGSRTRVSGHLLGQLSREFDQVAIVDLDAFGAPEIDPELGRVLLDSERLVALID